MEMYTSLKDVTIGNGVGQFTFIRDVRYSKKHLSAACLTHAQINMFFRKEGLPHANSK